MSVSFSQLHGKWKLYLSADANLLESAEFNEFGDAIDYGNQIYNNLANNFVI